MTLCASWQLPVALAFVPPVPGIGKTAPPGKRHALWAYFRESIGSWSPAARVGKAPATPRLRPDLFWMMAGFALGAAALLIGTGSSDWSPQLPHDDIDILEQA